ncbi:MAG: hypothetical protein N0A16_08260 [Blastocatellia bacterium]|nr:hypothetical protein [Blastocatellia bacterium]MCS7157709.1 hypothetical protein [Blastocatellia bacterium]MCX7751974.1 hypothetical protein [Blastocatellia bacterium]MDW8167080.1 hypothetical protein [Acidobacteriota bacterium]MDW8257184.1 hypothetical protein [Acidobacteriota bacterium]
MLPRILLSVILACGSPLLLSSARQIPPPPSIPEEGWVLVNVLVGNADEDPELEYLVLLRKASREEDEGLRIRFFDFDPQSRTWTPTEITNESQESESRLFPLETRVTLEDLTRDGRMEIVIRPRKTSSPSNDTDGLVILTKRGRYLHQLFASWEGTPELSDLDGDEIMEIVLHAEYANPMEPESPVRYPAQVFAYEDGTFRRMSLHRYAAYFSALASTARTEYETLKRRLIERPATERDHSALFRAIARVLLALRTQGDLDGMRAYYLTERSWLQMRLPTGSLQALDDLITSASLLKR